ncbi:DNA-binding transcriptional regulator, MarR family [Faunimonas pinastri]|uniref:DNA-binding transcriptional regulator, MarR family n=1 Tax=Faunimonas pinastri TaxID=1855383 RepID=A0A1H9P3U6_9HYPH|nr:MarR family winged helix-turn-helix transcriptional regulator [Faunimonas pinastri]SER42273.1 DNA-binding transcriptional regulator, MarR family [Faunimonas pinastri]
MTETAISLLLRVAKSHRSKRASALASRALHPGQDSVLLLLDGQDGCTMGDVAVSLGVQPPTVTKLVGRLIAAGLVRRHGVAGDQRKAAVFLTESGRQEVDAIQKIWVAIAETALNGIPLDHQDALRDALTRMDCNLDGRTMPREYMPVQAPIMA